MATLAIESDLRTRQHAVAHFSRNTHRHVEWVVMAPPRIGPRTLATAKTVDIMDMYFPYSARGTKVVAITMIKEYMPEAPMP